MKNMRHIEATIRKLESQLAATAVGDSDAMEVFAELKAARAEHAAAVQEQLERQVFGEKPAPTRTPPAAISDDLAARLWSIAVEAQTTWLRSDAPCHRGRIIGEAALSRYKARLHEARHGRRKEMAA